MAIDFGDIAGTITDIANNPDIDNIFDEIGRYQNRGRVNNDLDALATAIPDSQLEGNVDWRARLRPKGNGREFVYGVKNAAGESAASILQPLMKTRGMIFPYTPTLLLQGMVEYQAQSFHGSNYPIYSYINSRPPTLPVSGDFSATTIEEAQYLLAVFHFLRVCTKSYFGESAVANGRYGTPPPVLLFDYLGPYGFHKVPVVIESYSVQLNDEIDYVPVLAGGKTTYVPAEASIALNLLPQYTPYKLRKKFDLENLTNGSAYQDGFI